MTGFARITAWLMVPFMFPPTIALAQAPAQTLQARFDAATAAYSTAKCEQAVKLFDELAALPQVVRKPDVLGTVLARKGVCLQLLGRFALARDPLKQALKLLPMNLATARNDRLEAHRALGIVEFVDVDYAAARPNFEAALALSDTPLDRLNLELLLARTTLFDGGDIALKHADAALALLPAVPDISKKVAANVHTLHARVLLVRGDAAGALAELRKAVQAQGGLTQRVTLAQVATRSDLALAALLKGDNDAAREYLAYTGAGRTPDFFATANSMSPPDCGVDGLKPEDSAVVEFSITESGAVEGVAPVWASRPGPIATAFARSVRDWSWTRENAKKISAFFRAATRVELRCQNGQGRPSLYSTLGDTASQWVGTKTIAFDPPEGSDAAVYPKLVAMLDGATKDGDTLTALPVLTSLMQNAAADDKHRTDFATRAGKLATANGAPVEAQAYFAIQAARAGERDQNATRTALRALLADPRYAANAAVAATLKLAIAAPGYQIKTAPDASALVESITNDTRLPANHPLHVAALLALADLQVERGDVTAAHATFARTGLDAQQCALVAPTPAIRSSNVSSSDFPMEAQRWGFSGWVRIEVDVTPQGKTANQRAIIAYPPFVFREASVGIAKGMVFSKSYRPAGGTACTGYQNNIAFRAVTS